MMKMTKTLAKVIEKVESYEIKVEEKKSGENVLYYLSGFPGSKAFLYIEDGDIICETDDNQKDHIITFSDLVIIAKYWREISRQEGLELDLSKEWKAVFDDVHRYLACYDSELPF